MVINNPEKLSFCQNCIRINWIENENVQILEFNIFWPFSVEFISKTIRDRRNQLTYYKSLVQLVQRKKSHQNLDEK
jgi:hypothetical protein